MNAKPEVGPMTDKEAKEFIEKYAGGYSAYRRGVLAEQKQQPAWTAPKPIEKSAQGKIAEQHERIAKLKGQSLAQYYAENPAEYRLVRELGYCRED